MKFLLSSTVGEGRNQRAFILSEMNAFPFYLNCSFKFVICTLKVYPAKASRVIRIKAAVLTILEASGKSEVTPSIITSNSIDMIHIMFWPCASHVKPCETMSTIQFCVNFNANISGRVNGSRHLVAFCAVSTNDPIEFACLGMIVQEGFKSFLSEHTEILPGGVLAC